ncbi:MAG TPA: DsbA family protein [Longimicrobiaceae bacterium]|nr:DsbA family protein [Longimicrobiaceae bacterium]
MSRPPAPRGRSSLAPFYVIIGVVALAGVAFLLYQFIGKEKPTTQPVQVALDQAALNRVRGISIGRDDAPVVIYEFADFQCPGCSQFASMVTPLIKERLVQPGTVRYVYYDFPLIQIHPNAFLAARAGRCANEQGRFWEFHDIIYGQQPNWSAERDPADLFVSYAEQAGADRGRFEECLRSDRFAREVTENMQFGQSLGVQGTPTLIVNGRRLGSTPTFRELEQVVREAAGGASAGAPAETASAPAESAPADSVVR